MSSSLDYLELCRLCLVKDRVSVPIFEDEGDVRQIFLKITACLPVKVSREDKLPKKICDDCVYKVELFYQFWNTTANAEKQLLQWLGEVGGLEDKPGYVTEVLDTNVMKQETSSDSRLDGSVMQVGGHQNNMDMGMMDIITMPAGSEQQFTSVPMDTGGTVQTVQVVPGPSTQTTHDQMAQSQTSHLVGEESEEENSDDGCDNEEGLPVKEENDDHGDQPLETTFVALPCDEAGPSGLQQQKISELSEMSMQQTADNDPKTGSNSAEAESMKTFFIPKNNAEMKSSPEQESSMTLYQVSFVNDKTSYSLLPIKQVETKVTSLTKKKKTNRQTEQKFTCDECDLKFTTVIRLKAHKSTHKPLNKLSKVSRIRCHEETTGVTAVSRRKKSLKSHDEKVDEEIAVTSKQASKKALTFLCPSCEFRTNDRTIMLSHFSTMHFVKPSDIKLETSEEQTREHEALVETNEVLEKIELEEELLDQLNCAQCGFTCNNQDDLDFHTCEPSDDCISFTCHLCTYECLTRMGLQSHITRKHRPKPEKGASNAYECDECEFRSENKTSLYSHKRRHRSGKLNVSVKRSENKFFCNECDFAARTKSALYLHIQRRHKLMDSKPERPEFYSCEHCDYTNKTKYEMKVHVIRKHTNEYPHECKDCGKKYKIKGDLTNHIRFQHREQPIICDVCGKTCGNSNSLYVHQKFAHYKAEFECPICHRRMVSQANLDEHVLKQHEQREDAVCEECGKTFTRQSRLKIHMRIHTGLKPHACKICGKAFSRKTALRQHLLIHTGQRPYVCDICGKTFTQKPGLISHRKSHPGSHPPLPRITIDHVLSDLLAEGDDGVP